MTVSHAHHAALQQAIDLLDLSPNEVAFHYVRAALAAEGGCISATARRLGIHRRTLQRMLGKARPKPKVRAVL
ncbi:MAG: hypothetical protein BGO80_04015 [Devosia sp. 63-57]|nr:helix-turn-helix domain-containing protein [Devosia sp. 63-57]ODT50280.1 MAG: hypothetical protein ABS74_05015 [Pelagibacterium sp. SCN 63-126]ODU82744.1 MAG: hypothetical protein ABT14_16505 [Pelagibacterium sp. SCN 63-17]OJX45024.1 MAG: hypothetical protein BGO80_04015 [Devosia sp. 63-57]